MAKVVTKKKCYLADPHLFYHLESPVKITQLLQSGLYLLDGNNLVSTQTQQKLKISNYTLAQVPSLIREKFRKKQKDKINILLYSVQNSPLKLTSRKTPTNLSTKDKAKTSLMREFSKIKGLKQFNSKIL